MREFKFRAWDGVKMWPYAVPLLSPAYNSGMINVSMNANGSSNDFVNGTLLQSTGLKDCKSKEIYEGDISQDDEGPYFVEWDSKHGGWAISTPDEHFSDSLESWITEFEIIGNIYEHNHLISPIPAGTNQSDYIPDSLKGEE